MYSRPGQMSSRIILESYCKKERMSVKIFPEDHPEVEFIKKKNP